MGIGTGCWGVSQLIAAYHSWSGESGPVIVRLVEVAVVAGLVFAALALWGVLTTASGFDLPIESRIDGLLAGFAAANIAAEFFVLPASQRIRIDASPQAVLILAQATVLIFIVAASCGIVWRPTPEGKASFAFLVAAATIQAFTFNWGARDLVQEFDGGIEKIFVGAGVYGCICLACNFAVRASRRRGGITESGRVIRALGLPGLCVLAQAVVVIHIALDPARHWTPLVFIVPSFVLIAYRLSLTSSLAQRLTERTRERDRMAALVDMSRAIADAADTSSLARELAVAGARAVRCAHARIALATHDGQEPRWFSNAGTTVPVPAVDYSRCLLGHLSDAPGPLALRRPSVALPELVNDCWTAEGKHFALVAPLRAQGELIGLIELWDDDPDWSYASEDVAVVAAMGQEASLAIQHAHALDSARRSAEDRALILRVSQAATSVLGLRTVADEIALSSLAVAGAESCGIELWLPEEHVFEVIADRSIAAWPSDPVVGHKRPGNSNLVYQYAFSHTEPLLIRRGDPILDDPVLAEFAELWGIGSAVIYPLWDDGQLIGLLEIFARDADAFDAAAIRLGQEVAAQAGLAIRHAHILAVEKRNAEERAILLRISQAATSSPNLGDLLHEISTVAIELPQIESCSVRLWRKESNTLERVAGVAVPGWDIVRVVQRNLDTRALPMSSAMTQRDPVGFDTADAGMAEHRRRWLLEFGIGSMLLVPLWIEDECVGELIFASRQSGGFGGEVHRLGREIGQLTAVAIQRARSVEDIRQLADEQAAMLRVSQTIGQSLDTIEVFKEVTAAGLSLPGFESCQLELWRPETRQLEIGGTSCIPEWPGGSPRGTLIDGALWPTTLSVIESRQPLIFGADSPFLTDYERNVLFINDATGTVLIVPIVTGDRCVGTLTYYSRSINAFHDRHIRVGLYLANLAALSIERARVHAALEEQAITDGLTGLLNHRAVQDRLEAEISRSNREGRPLAVLMIDVDQFKLINDAHGHLIGDRTLQEVSKCLRRSVRISDHIGRYGGDEFLIVLPGAEQAEALIAAERILQNASLARVLIGDELIEIQLSVGVAIYPLDGSDSTSLIAAADHSMYAAKQLHASQPPRLLSIEAARPKKHASAGASALSRPVPL